MRITGGNVITGWLEAEIKGLNEIKTIRTTVGDTYLTCYGL